MPAVGARPEVDWRGVGEGRGREGEEEMISDAARRGGHHDRGTNGRRCSTRLAGDLSAATRLPLAARPSDRHTPHAPISARRRPTSAPITPLLRSPGTPPASRLYPHIILLQYIRHNSVLMRYNCTRTLPICNDINESVRNLRVQVQCDRSSPNIHENNNKSRPPPTSRAPRSNLHIQHRECLHRPPVSPRLRRAWRRRCRRRRFRDRLAPAPPVLPEQHRKA